MVRLEQERLYVHVLSVILLFLFLFISIQSANRTDACFIRVIGSELVQKYVGEGARMVRELFEMAKAKKACIIFFDEVDAIGGARFDDGMGGDNEVQRTMLELINQLDGFDSRGAIKVGELEY
jgi:26S proteasome regulatory subunit T1